jgi:hypothetical protein
MVEAEVVSRCAEFIAAIEAAPHNLQPRHYRLIQQINRLLESLILDECRIGLLCCLDRGMAKQVLNIRNCSVWVSNSYLCRDWKLNTPTAMRLPAVTVQVGLFGCGTTAELLRRITRKRSMEATVVVIGPERVKSSLQIDRVPK